MSVEDGETSEGISPSLTATESAMPSPWLGFLAFIAALIVPLLLWWLTFTTPHPASPAHKRPELGGAVPDWVIGAGLAALLAWPLVKGTAQKHWYLFRCIRFAMVAQTALLAAVTLGFALGLVTLFPFLDRSWLYRVLPEQGASNLIFLPARLPLVGLPYLLLVIAILPQAAADEERRYRRGTRDWRHGIFRSIRFGLVHCLVGVPLFAGIALIVPGLWFTHLYFRQGEEQATTHHLTYNLLLVALFATVLLFKF